MTVTLSRKSILVNRQINNLDTLIHCGIRQAFFQHGKLVQRTARHKIINPPKTGRLYNVPGTNRRHRASAPGEAPANLSGALQRSIDFKVSTNELEVGADTHYAKRLELGDDKIAARPYLWPSIQEHEQDLVRSSELEIKAEHNKL